MDVTAINAVELTKLSPSNTQSTKHTRNTVATGVFVFEFTFFKVPDPGKAPSRAIANTILVVTVSELDPLKYMLITKIVVRPKPIDEPEHFSKMDVVSSPLSTKVFTSLADAYSRPSQYMNPI